MRAAIILASLVAAGGPARADRKRPEPIPQKARDLADRGRAYHDAGDYADAIAAFREAYVLAPSPGLLFNLAQAYRLAGQCDDAAWMYRRYLDTNPAQAQRALAETHLATVEKCGHGGLRIAVAPTLVPQIPEPRPEQHVARAVAAAPLEVTAQAAGTTGSREKRIGVALAIGGSVVLAGAGYFALDAYSASNTVSQAYQDGGKWSDVAAANQRGQRSQTMAELLGITGGLAVASGAVLYTLGRHYEQAQHVAVVPTAGGAGVHVSWGF
ncbi:MAG: tetratricopeptide repeat protein [Acidobacteriota bacterium]